MELEVHTIDGQQVAEGSPGQLLVGNGSAVDEVLEFCFAHRVRLVLLHSDNLADDFFDLRSGMAGIVLQKFRTYRRQVAIVLSPTRELNDRFRELIAEENQGPYVRFFAELGTARHWLVSGPPAPDDR